MSIVLSCPSCTTRYRANPQAIGSSGRRVRCASCGHVWTAEVEDPADLPALQAALPIDEEPAEIEPEKKVHTVFRERQAAKRRTMSAAVAGSAWGGLVAACALFFLTAWIFRVDVVTLWPRASSAYAAVGADVNPYGFSVGTLNVERDIDHGVPLLVVEGDLHNFDRRTRTVPGLRAILRDETGQALLEWNIPLEATRVRAGRRQDFRTVVSDPPPQAVEVEVVVAAAPRQDEPALDESHPETEGETQGPETVEDTAGDQIEPAEIRNSTGQQTAEASHPPPSGGQH